MGCHAVYGSMQSQKSTSQSLRYRRRQPEKSLLYQAIAQNIDGFIHARAEEGRDLPPYVIKEFNEYLKCGRLECGFVRVRCSSCEDEFPVALSCKKRGFCPSCTGKRMVETSAHLVDNILPVAPYRQWIVTLPVPLRFWCATNRKLRSKVHRIIIKTIESYYKTAAESRGISDPQTGAVTFVQHFGSALNFNLHYHILFLDGVYSKDGKRFYEITDLANANVEQIIASIAGKIIKHCQKLGLISDDPEQIQNLKMDELFEENSVITAALQASIKGRIAFGERAGEYVRYLGSGLGFMEEVPLAKGHLCYSQNGFTVHAATHVAVHARKSVALFGSGAALAKWSSLLL